MFFKRKKTQEETQEPRTAEQQLADIAGELIKQNKAASRRRLIIFLLIFVYFAVMTIIGSRTLDFIDGSANSNKPFVAEVILSGVIAEGGGINSDDATMLLEDAFASENSKAVILRLNSGGGSPVQAAKIYDSINRLRDIYNKKIYVVIEDICASGCYYIASAADEIYANKSSIIGSIGVIIPSFGFSDLIEDLGIERRVYVAGDNKNMLDIFSPENKEDTQYIQEEILAISHNNFIDDVKRGRGDILAEDEEIFSGLIWLGSKAEELGLIDGLGDAYFVATKVIKINERVKFERKRSIIEELTQASFGFLIKNNIIKLH